MEDRHVTAAPVPLKLGDLDLILKPLTDEQIEELNEYVRDQFVKGSMSRMPDTLSQTDKRLHLSVIYSQAQELSWLHGSGARMMASRTGLSRIIWTMARTHHPDVTHKQIHDLIVSEKDMMEADRAFNRANTMRGKAKARPKQSRPQTGRKSKSGAGPKPRSTKR